MPKHENQENHLLFRKISFVYLIVISIVITFTIGCSSRNDKNKTGLALHDLAAEVAYRIESAIAPSPGISQSDNKPSLLNPELSIPDPEQTSAINIEPYVFEKIRAIPAANLLSYYGLNDAEMKLYDELLAGLLGLEPIIHLESPWETEDDAAMFRFVYNVILAVHPEIFWLSLDWTQGRFSNGKAFIRPVYLIDGQSFAAEYNGSSFDLPTENEMDAAKAWIERQQMAFALVLDNLPLHKGMTLYEIELAVHDWLSVNIAYDKSTINKDSIYGALVERSTACEGYSNAFQYIMGLAGI